MKKHLPATPIWVCLPSLLLLPTLPTWIITLNRLPYPNSVFRPPPKINKKKGRKEGDDGNRQAASILRL